jgi:chromosome partitioning protein
MKVITISNQKGGVAKTTTTINLAAAMLLFKRRCLVIDLDPQAHLTAGLDIPTNMPVTSYNVLVEGISMRDAIITTKWEGLDIVPSSIVLANAELQISGIISRESILKKAIRMAQLSDEYDFIFIDTSPTLGVLNLNGLCAANSIIIPVEPASFSLQGVEWLANTIELVQDISKIDIAGILLTRVPARSKDADLCRADLGEKYGPLVFNTIINSNEKIKESQRNKTPLVFYDHKAKAAIQYIELAKEMLTDGQ